MLVLVAIGHQRSPTCATALARRWPTRSPRLRDRDGAHAGALAHAFYFDAAIDALFVKPATALGRWFGGMIDPRVIDAGVREATISAIWLGHLFRSFQTGLVRAYALALAFGAACFALYYAIIGAGDDRYRSRPRPDRHRPLALRLAESAPTRRRAASGSSVAALAFWRDRPFPTGAPDAIATWLSRPFTAAFHFGYGPISYWIVLLLAATTFSALHRDADAARARASPRRC